MGCKQSQLNREPKKEEIKNIEPRLIHHPEQNAAINTAQLLPRLHQCASSVNNTTQSTDGVSKINETTETYQRWLNEAKLDKLQSVVKECQQLELQIGIGFTSDITTLTPMDRVPPEVWNLVFVNLHDVRDCISAYNVSVYWKDMMHSSLTSWLFSMIFPLLFEHLSKRDILQCRLVCKRWCFGVDYFLENCAFHRPAFEPIQWDLAGHIKKFYNTELRLQYLERTLKAKNLAYFNLYEADKMNMLLVQAIDHPRCPFIGKSADILESLSVTTTPPPPNVHFLHVFGHHLSFVQLVMENFPPLETFTRLLGLLSALPNLKKLKLICIIVSSSDLEAKQLCSHCRNETLPKLETLDLIILPTRHVQVVEELLNLFGNESLQSFSTNVIPVAPNWYQICNLSYLTISLDSDTLISSLLLITCPLQRLSLRLYGHVSAPLVFKVLRHFKNSLRNFTLSLCPYFFADLTISGFQNSLLEQLDSFSTISALDGFPHLKRTMISTWYPISFNYLCGLQKTLECLHISLKGMEEWERFTTWVCSKNRCIDKLDLLEHSKVLIYSNRMKIYKSNVWTVFPRLKILTIQMSSIEEHRNGGEWEYRRDIYDQFKVVT